MSASRRANKAWHVALRFTALCAAAGCTGSLNRPSQGGSADVPGGGNGSDAGAGAIPGGGGGAQTGGTGGGGAAGAGVPPGQEPAGVGTQVFELCKGGEEQPGPRLLRLLTRREYKNTVRDLLFINDANKPDVSSVPLEARVRGSDNNAHSQAVTSRHVDSFVSLGESLAKEAVQNQKGQLLPCDQNQASCARTFVERFGLRAFRRPLTTAELDRYAALFANDLTQGYFDEGMRLTIGAMLGSPVFLYRSEVGEPEGANFRLTPYEVASALSYLYLGSMPDQALLDAAKSDALKTPEQLVTQAKRLLDTARGKEQLGEFSLQWLRSDNVLTANKDKAVYPAFNDSLREAMVEEQRRFFTRVVLEERGTFEQLFTPSYVTVNRELASFYGLTAPANDYDKVQVGDSGRGGILGLGAVLASHAHQNESSPIKRGLFVRDRLLCQVLPDPPKDIDTTPPGLDPKLTTRERFARHTADAACSGCHQFIDGVGFGLEGFDGVGQQRTVENGLPIDVSGELRGVEGLGEASAQKFSGPRELAALLRDSDSAKACLAMQYFRFGRGYEEREADACSLAALRERFEEGGLALRDLLETLPQLKSFVIRSAE
jgi:hypothetical protein